MTWVRIMIVTNSCILGVVILFLYKLCSYKEIQSNDSAKNFHNTNLKGSYGLGLFLTPGEDKKAKISLSCSSMAHPLQIPPAGIFWHSSTLRMRGFFIFLFFFHSLWHFQTDTTQGLQCSGWELSLGHSAGPLPPRAVCLNPESCC